MLAPKELRPRVKLTLDQKTTKLRDRNFLVLVENIENLYEGRANSRLANI